MNSVGQTRPNASGVGPVADSVHPVVFLVLNLPFGITTGFIVVGLPFIATRSGLSVAATAGIVAIGLTPKAAKVLWAAVADVSLSLKAWYRIGALIGGTALLLQTAIPITRSTAWLLAAAAFASEFGSSLLTIAVGGLMATATPDNVKGRVGAWYQLGGKLGRGLSGGMGVWLANHASPLAAGIVLGGICVLCTLGLGALREPTRVIVAPRLSQRMREIGRELWAFMRTPNGMFVVAAVMLPIGVSGVDNFWSGIAREWRVSADAIAAVIGIGSVIMATTGCLFAGWWSDHADRRVVMLASGGLVAAVVGALAVAPRVAAVFVVGTLALTATLAMCDAAFSGMALAAIGKGAAATKYAVLGGLGNLPELYMTATMGWVHDRWNTSVMLSADAVAELICVVVGALVLRRMYHRASVASLLAPPATATEPAG